MQNNSVLERSYINDFHRQNSMGAVKEVESMLLHPYSREQKLAQINSLHQKAVSTLIPQHFDLTLFIST